MEKQPTNNQDLLNLEETKSNNKDVQLPPSVNFFWLGTLSLIIVMITFVTTSLIIIYKVFSGNKVKDSPSSSVSSINASSNTLKSISASGYLEPDGGIIYVSAPAFLEGTRVEKLLVKEGDKVTPGQIIAIIDNRKRLESALRLSQQKVKVAQEQLLQVKAGSKKGDINAQLANIKKLQAELQGQIIIQKAQIASLQDRLEGENKAQKATTERLKEQLKNAIIECNRYQLLSQSGAVSSSLRDSKCLEEKSLHQQVNESEANLLRIVSSLKDNISEAQANLDRTKMTLQNQIIEAQSTLNSISEVRPIDVSLAESQVEEAIISVQQAQENLDLSYVRSPRSGQILKIHTWPGEIINNQGIVELGETEQMYAVAEVYQTDISKVHPGQKALITSPVFSGELQGIVTEIGLKIGKKDTLGNNSIADPDARVIEVKIKLNPQDSAKVSKLTNLEVNIIIDIVD